MQKTMTAQELYDYIRCFTTVIVGEEQESSFLFILIGTENLKLSKMNGISRITGNVMKHPKKRDGGFILYGESFKCDIDNTDKRNHVIRVTSDTIPFPIVLDLRR